MKSENMLENLRDAVVPEAINWVKMLEEYRLHKGKDLNYFTRARIGVSVISAAARLCATVENARSNDIMLERLVGRRVGAGKSRKALKSG